MSDDIDKLASAQRSAWGRPKGRLTPRVIKTHDPAASSIAECPHWVPDDLVKEWKKVAAAKDEYAAAAHVRELKRRRVK